MFFDCTPENFVPEENISKFFSTPRKLLLETLTVSGSTWCYKSCELSPPAS